MYFWERDRQSMSTGGTERETQNQKQAPGFWVVSTKPNAGIALTNHKISSTQPARSWPELKLDAQPTEPLRPPPVYNCFLQAQVQPYPYLQIRWWALPLILHPDYIWNHSLPRVSALEVIPCDLLNCWNSHFLCVTTPAGIESICDSPRSEFLFLQVL